jgi:hypothetical protein
MWPQPTAGGPRKRVLIPRPEIWCFLHHFRRLPSTEQSILRSQSRDDPNSWRFPPVSLLRESIPAALPPELSSLPAPTTGVSCPIWGWKINLPPALPPDDRGSKRDRIARHHAAHRPGIWTAGASLIPRTSVSGHADPLARHRTGFGTVAVTPGGLAGVNGFTWA